MDKRFARFRWTRDPANPVRPPVEAAPWESHRCMNPFAVVVGDRYHLYYSGGDAAGFQRLCLATASIDNPTAWKRHGVILDHGAPDLPPWNAPTSRVRIWDTQGGSDVEKALHGRADHRPPSSGRDPDQ